MTQLASRRFNQFGILILALILPSPLLAQAPFLTYGCRTTHPAITLQNPRTDEDGLIVPGQRLLQVKFNLDPDTAVDVIEYPKSGQDIDLFNSTVAVLRNRQEESHPLKEIIQGGDGLRIVQVAHLCASSNRGLAILAFESYATGDEEGFAIIDYDQASVHVKGVPLEVWQGRIVISTSAPDRVEVWSTTSGEEANLCRACDKHYMVYDCRIGDTAIRCTKRPGLVGPLPPDDFTDHPITVRETPHR